MAFNKKEVFQSNLEALKLSLDIVKNIQRKQSIEEQILILDRFRGFGGIKEVLLSNDPKDWNKSSLHLFEYRQELEGLCTQMDLSLKFRAGTFYDSIKNSILSAFFTPKEISDVIATKISHVFKPNLILEPSAGAGVFIDSLMNTKAYNANSQLFGVEKDILTSTLLKSKYLLKGLYKTGHNGTLPVNLYTGAFEKHSNSMDFFKRRFDLTISNIPFGDIQVFDEKYIKDKRPVVKQSTQRIHNYFFVKNLDLIKDGGIMAFVVTASFLNTPGNESIRKYLLSKADIVSVTRFPNMLFNDHAGTEVSSDLIILQKNERKQNLTAKDTLLATTVSDKEYGNVNSYFNFYRNNNDYIADNIKLGTDLYGKPAAILEFSGSIKDIANLLDAKIDFDITKFKAQKQKISLDLFSTQTKHGEEKRPLKNIALQFDLFNPILELNKSQEKFSGKILNWHRDNVLVTQGNQVGHLKTAQDGFNFETLDVKLDFMQASKYIMLRDVFNQLYQTEKELLIPDQVLREKAASLYQDYLANYGQLNARKSRALINFDDLAPQSFAMEKRSINELKEFVFLPADLFTQPVAFKTDDFKQISPLDALFLSVNTLNRVDIDFIKERSGAKNEMELLEELKDFIFFDFIKSEYQYKDQFLSGNVAEKLDFYKHNYSLDELERTNTVLGQSFHELKKVLPKPILFDQLDFNLGERWLDKKYYEDFASKLFEEAIKIIYLKGSDSFKAKQTGSGSNSIIDQAYAVKTESETFNGLQLLEYGLVSNTPSLTKVIGHNLDGEPIRGADHEGMRKVALKIEEITQRFREYMQELSPKQKVTIADRYNYKFNCFSTHKSNGEHMQFSGLEKFIPNDHQKDATWKLVLNGGGICDHPVGAGKSLVMALVTQKMREIGFAKKPMIACLKANAADVAKDYMLAFPSAKVLFPGDGDFSRPKRLSFLNMIKNNDWDCVILTHEQFSMIPQSKDIQESLLSRELQQVQEDIDQVREEGGEVSKKMLKGLEKRKANLSVKLETVLASIKKENDIPNFRELGIDHLSVDESHEFKNLAFTTRHGRVAGLGNSLGSQRAFNMLVACRTLQELHGDDKGISFYSGTTISNSLTELYNLFKYLAPTTLEKQNIYNFDSWASVFTQKSTEYEVSVTNQLIMKERFRTFIKVPELCALYGKITHYISQKDLKIDRPEDKVILVNIPLTQQQTAFSEKLIEFAQNGDGLLIHRQELTESEKMAKMLIATNAARNMAVDMRLISSIYDDEEDNKLSISAKKFKEWYDRSTFCKGTQLIFCDLGTPGKKGRFDVYNEFKRKLVEDHGIPAHEIAFIHDAKSDRARANLFKKVRDGEIRGLMGSTKKMGVGVNVQDRVVSTHDLNVPWTPKDLEQRHGRGPRQGNWVAKKYFDNLVHGYVYASERSLDAYGFNLLRNKQLFIDQVKRNTISVRTVDEGALDEGTGLPFKEYVAVLSGNTDLLEKLKLEKKIAGLEAEKKSFIVSQNDMEWKLKEMKTGVLKTEKVYHSLLEDSTNYKSVLKTDSKTGAKLNPITLNGVKFASSEDVGNSLLGILNQAKKDCLNQVKKIGELYGFDLYIKPGNFKDEYLMFAKKSFVEYSYSNGIPNDNPALAARYFLNAIDKSISLTDGYKKQLEEQCKNINLLQNQKARTWDKGELLNKLKADANILENRIINAINHTSSENATVLYDQKQHKEQGKEMVNVNFKNLNTSIKNR